ncbi:MAG: DUF1080 domain-containing protein [Bacteroidota bacterium]
MKQIIYLFTALLFLGFSACSSSPKAKEKSAGDTDTEEVAVADNTLTEKEKEEGWLLLFDGETSNGWREYDNEAFPDTGWYIEDGMLVCENSGKGEAGFGGDIIFDKKFTNFHFKVDWMVEEGGNSGIFYLAQEIPGKKIWYTAPEMQILDNFGSHVDNKLGKDGNRRAGSLYDLIAPDPQNAKGAMEWNSFEILSYEGTIAYFMNGENVIEFHLWTDEWKEMIAHSKFPDFNPDFADVAKTGYIGLQDHGHAVWFKNIKILEL